MSHSTSFLCFAVLITYLLSSTDAKPQRLDMDTYGIPADQYYNRKSDNRSPGRISEYGYANPLSGHSSGSPLTSLKDHKKWKRVQKLRHKLDKAEGDLYGPSNIRRPYGSGYSAPVPQMGEYGYPNPNIRHKSKSYGYTAWCTNCCHEK